MRFCDVPGMANVLRVPGGLVDDPLWRAGHETITSMSIQMFYARAGLRGQRQQAIDLIDQAQAVVITAHSERHLPKGAFAALVLHETPPPPFLADEFVDGLTHLRPSRRGACIFMLENKLTAQAVTDLTWSELNQNGQTTASLEALNAARVVRHIKLPYVFWEWATESIAAPLLGLGASIEQAFGCDLAQLQARYDRMILIDCRSEGANFLSLVKQVGG